MVSGTALSVQNREYLNVQGCVSSMFEGSDQKYFQSVELPHIGQSFYLHSRWHSNAHTLFPPSHSAYPESSPKDVTLATSLPSATPEAIKEHPISMHKKDNESGGIWSLR